MLTWEHTGFSVDASIRVLQDDREGLRRLVRYMARPAVSFERIEYDDHKGEVTVKSSKKRHGMRPVVATYPVLTFIVLLVLQVPLPGVHLVRYYGWYASACRGRRTVLTGSDNAAAEIAAPHVKERRRRWAELLRLVFEIDPLKCAKCGGNMRLVAFISTEQSDVIERMMGHLGQAAMPPAATGPPLWHQVVKDTEHCQSRPELYPDAEPDDSHYHDQTRWI